MSDPTGLNWGGSTGLFGWGNAADAGSWMTANSHKLLPSATKDIGNAIEASKPAPHPDTSHPLPFHVPHSRPLNMGTYVVPLPSQDKSGVDTSSKPFYKR